MKYGTDLLARHGTFVLVGQPAEGVHFAFQDLVFKDIRVVGTMIGECEDGQGAIDLVAKHDIKVTTKTYRLEDINQLVEESHSATKKGKSVVVFE